MDPEQQAHIKSIADAAQVSGGRDNLIVVLGSSDIEGALISAETVTTGDPSYTGPLAGVSLGLPVYHILEPEIKEAVPADVYQENVGIWELTLDTEAIGREFRAVRKQSGQAGG
jgi:glycine/sarcosine/betaine reductase complex component A